MAVMAAAGLAAVLGGAYLNANGSSSSTSRQSTALSQEAYDKLITDILSDPNAGLAQLGQSENASGGYGSSSKALGAQDLVVNAASQLSQIIGEKETSSASSKKSSSICTELVIQRKLDVKLYTEGYDYFASMSPKTVLGYYVWAAPVSKLMHRFPRFANLFIPIAVARYNYILGIKSSFLGWSTVAIGEKICYCIGTILSIFCKSPEKLNAY